MAQPTDDLLVRAPKSRGTRAGNRVNMADAVAFAWHYWRPQKGRLLAIALLTLVVTAAEVAAPYLSGLVITAIGRGDSAQAWWLVTGVLACGALFWGLRYVIFAALWIPLSVRCMQDIILDGFARVQRFSTQWHSGAFAGATVRKITRGMWAYDMIGDILVLHLSTALLVTFGLVTLIAVQFPLIGAFIAVAVVFYTAASIALARYYVDPVMRASADQDSTSTGVLADAVTCNPVVKSFGSESREEDRVRQSYAVWGRASSRAWCRMEATLTGQGALMLGLYATIVGLGLYLWTAGKAGPGDIVFLMSAYMMIAAYLRGVGDHVRMLQRGVNDIEDLVRFFDQPLGVVDQPNARRFVPGPGRIEVQRVRFGYTDDRLIYDGLDLTIEPGETVALVGHSGSGKSTLIKLVQRLYDIQGGRIMIDGQDIAGLQQASLRQAIALVPQDPVLFHRSLAENIAYAKPDATLAEVERAARLARADRFIADLPQGYDTLVGERGVKLSGGERQRIAIARAILSPARILILDEATSSLDSLSEALIQEAMEEVTRDRTAILVAHRLSTVKDADRILVFDQGRIVEQGRHEVLVHRPGGLYRALFEKQALGLLDDGAAQAALAASRLQGLAAE